MSALYTRILLWHKLVAMQTGGLALCSAKHRLNRDEAKGWSTTLRNVVDDIDTFLETGEFILDDRGQRVIQSTAQEVPHEVAIAPSSSGSPKQAVSRKAGGLRVATRKKQ